MEATDDTFEQLGAAVSQASSETVSANQHLKQVVSGGVDTASLNKAADVLESSHALRSLDFTKAFARNPLNAHPEAWIWP